jgi:TonB-dependent starch-binding outer membrane protein SusC
MKKVVIFAILCFSAAALVGQQRVTVSGAVTDDTNLGLPGVTIIEEGTQNGTVTNFDGEYTIEVAPQANLVFSFVGFQSQTVPVQGRSVINVRMIQDVMDIEEVVVIGYGTLVVRDLTSAIATIRSDELERTPAGQVMQGLQGKVAGLQVVSSGAPGDAPTIRVRGIGSYPGQGNEAPLYVVDGMFFDNIDFLNPADIATVSILKDASAAAIYGVRAANGVVLIETKSGSFNRATEITYDGYFGYQVPQNVLKMANAEQFTTMAMESGSAPDIANIANAMQRYGRSRINPNVPNVNTDWYKEIMRVSPIQNHSLNVMGGSENATYSIGSSYFFQEGILDMKNNYERFNLRAKVDFNATDWFTIGGNVIFSNSQKYIQESDAWSQAYWAVPILPLYDEMNTAAWPINFASAQDIGFRGGQNPLPTLEFNNNRQQSKQTLVNFYGQINFIPTKLNFRTTYNHSFTNINQRNVDLPFYISDAFQRPNAGITKRAETMSNQIWDNILTYTDRLGDHNVTVMLGHSYRDESWQMLTARGLDFPYDREESWYIDQAERIPVDNVHDGGMRQYGISYFGRVSYNFNDRYLLYGTMRADGSSKYQEKWGYFPTIGIGWVPSEEAFMVNTPYIDFLKLRASWGQLGNDKIQASDGARTTTPVDTAIDDNLVPGTITSSTFSSLEWEMTEELNFGITARLFNSRLSMDVDYYIRDTKNAAIFVNIPAVGGTVLRNVGIIRNSGFELLMNWSNTISNEFSYNVSVNLSTLKNEVRDLFGQPYIDGGMAEFRQRSMVGQPLMAFFGYEVLGVYQNQEEIQADPVAVANNLVPGDFRYRDQNNDGVVNDDDRVILGSYFPTFMYGGSLGITFRNLSLNAYVMGQTGNKILNRKRGEVIWTPDLNMDADLALNRWHGEGTSNQYPSSAGLRKGWNQRMSTFFVEDGSFFRVQNVQLSYNLRGQEWFGTAIPNTRISLTAERPLTVFSYNGFNPEVPDGIDRQTYPIPAVYTLGLNINF